MRIVLMWRILLICCLKSIRLKVIEPIQKLSIIDILLITYTIANIILFSDFLLWETRLLTPLIVKKLPYRSITSTSFRALSCFNWLKAPVRIYKRLWNNRLSMGLLLLFKVQHQCNCISILCLFRGRRNFQC